MAKAGLAQRRAARQRYEKARATKPLGEGSRFAALAAAAKASGAQNPEAVAAAAGRKAHGQKTMTALSVRGRKRARAKKAG